MTIERASQISDPGRRATATVAEPPFDEVVGRLVDALAPEQIYLFGSRARGDNQPHSDYDFMVIVPQSDLPAHRRAQFAHRALGGIQVAADVLVWTRQEFDRFLPVPGSLAATVLREGRLLHDARPQE